MDSIEFQIEVRTDYFYGKDLVIPKLFRNFVAEVSINTTSVISRLIHIALLLTAFVIQTKADNLGYTKEKPLVFGIDMDYAPLEYIDDKGVAQGFDIRFTEILMNRLDIPYKYSPNTWENIAGDVLEGRVDLGMMVFSPYRQNQTNYSRAVFRLYYQMLTRKGEKFYGLRNARGKEFAFMESRPIKDTLLSAGANIVLVKDLKRATYELARGKYDAVICFRYQAKHLMANAQLDNLEAQDLTLMSREYCYVSHDKKLIDAINVELDKMESEGVIEDVYGNVRTQFGGLRIPRWIWFLIAGVLLVSLLTIIFLQVLSGKKLKAEMIRAKKSEELKDVFLSNLSHSLRTPLNAIIGFSDLMISTPDGEMPEDERIHLLNLINDNGLQLLHLINELLSLSDIEGNNHLFDRVVTDIDLEMSLYASEIRQQLKDGVRMEVVEPMGGMRALLDAKLLRLITMHLLENAVQHTDDGSITLSYYSKEDGLYVEVKDTGKGLPENLKENIFTLLSDKNTAVQEEAPGLGLSICKAIIDRTGGKIGMYDNKEDGRGSIFWFWAPVKVLS